MKEAKENEEDKRGYVARTKSQLEKLTCDMCDKFICWCYEYDLNESHFYCEECYKKIPKYYFPN